jgi:hypothetical protein
MQWDFEITTLERAFQLAKSGRCRSIQEVRLQLSCEGYSPEQITGRALSRQLLALIRAARPIQ